MHYRCPICSEPLQLIDKTWACSANHRFDRAKEGYVNLLPVNKKGSKDPGDNKQMMFARREFLNQGYYQILSDRINELASEFAYQPKMALDIGCGEGYYTHRLYDTCLKSCQCHCYGVDISKSALKYAAKRYKDINFCVASAFDMPFADEHFDLMVRIFAPSLDGELRRVAKPGAILITATAGEMHHFALKKLIYREPKPHITEDSYIEGFTLLSRENLISRLNLVNRDDINHFLNMTPYSWKLSDKDKQDIREQKFSCELDFKLEVFRAV